MPSLKTQLAKDVATFINTDEFADLHTIDNQEVKAIIDTSVFDEVKDTQAVLSNLIQIHISQDALIKLPTEGADFLLDGFRYTCKNIKIEQGCNVITAEQNNSR